MSSLAVSLASLSETERADALAGLSEAQCEELLWDWGFWARPNQLPPAACADGSDWLYWLILAGRGFGKTRTGAEWVRSIVCGKTPMAGNGYGRIALIAETAADARDVMVEGESGILAVHPKDFRPHYEPSKRRLTWPNGAVATLYNAVEPDQLRGPQHDAAWCDELAKWRYAQETWDQLQFGLRLGTLPRACITTTPRPIPVLKSLLKEAGPRDDGKPPRAVVTRGSTDENRANLATPFLNQIVTKYEGTRLGRQELSAEILDDMPDALWTRQRIEDHRRNTLNMPPLRRVVVAIDPAAKTNEIPEDGAATGIVAAALGDDGRGYVLEDATMRGSPNEWARMAVALYDKYEADCIVGETNNGGEMVKAVIRAVRSTAPFKEVTASRGKWVRAEPIAALYEQGRVSHVGTFAALEDEMVMFGPNGMAGGASPDRVDALVWALSELFPRLTKKSEPRPSVELAQSDYSIFGE